MATSRPPGQSLASAEAIWRCAASGMARSTWASAEKGGFISTTVGAIAASRRSSICAASKRLTRTPGKRRPRRSARVSANSLSENDAPASSAKMARSPVPADGSRTRSVEVSLAAVLAASPSSMGVENCCRASLSTERRVWLGSSAAIFMKIVSSALGEGARERSAGAIFRRKSTLAASDASYAVFQSQAPSASEPPNDCSMASRKTAPSTRRPRSREARIRRAAERIACALAVARESAGAARAAPRGREIFIGGCPWMRDEKELPIEATSMGKLRKGGAGDAAQRSGCSRRHMMKSLGPS